MAYLIVREPGRVAYTLPLRHGMRAGREDDNELVLIDRQVSRHHLCFVAVEGGFEVEDLGSTHGIRLNGGPAGPRSRVADGDYLQIGNSVLVFCDGDDTGELLEPQPVTDGSMVAAAPDAPAGRLAIFYELSRALANLDDAEALLDRLLGATIDLLGCARGSIGLVGPRNDLRCTTRRRAGARPPEGDDPLVLARTLRAAVLERRHSVLISGVVGEPPESLVRARVRSAMAAPLLVGAELLGLIYVDDGARENRFNAGDLEFLTALASLTAAALASAERYRRAAITAQVLRQSRPTDSLLGASPEMQRLKRDVQRYAASSAVRVFLHGESGAGKELVARTLHDLSPRADGPFVAVNCAALPDTMIEAELFGHEKGAFTGAIRDRRGKLVLADRGTLFLDEVGDLSLAAQAKLLRAIEDGEVQPLGSERTLRLDLRVISATHKDLAEEVAARRFREDLYYRLNVVEIEVPPLRRRAGDVPLLAQAFLLRGAARLDKRVEGFHRDALDLLERHAWPGNVRELQNEVERAVIVAEGALVEVEDLSPRLRRSSGGSSPHGGEAATLARRFAQLEVSERTLVEEALAATHGNVAEAARLLGISRIMMRRRVERFGAGDRSAPPPGDVDADD